MVGLYAYNPPAILEVAKSKSMAGEIKIVGFDEDWETLKAIAAGEIEATVVQDPFMYGYRSVEALAAKAKGDDSKLVKEADPVPSRHEGRWSGPGSNNSSRKADGEEPEGRRFRGQAPR